MIWWADFFLHSEYPPSDSLMQSNFKTHSLKSLKLLLAPYLLFCIFSNPLLQIMYRWSGPFFHHLSQVPVSPVCV